MTKTEKMLSSLLLSPSALLVRHFSNVGISGVGLGEAGPDTARHLG